MRNSPSMILQPRSGISYICVPCPECKGVMLSDALDLCTFCNGDGRLLIPDTPPRDLANRTLLRYALRYVLLAAAVVILIVAVLASR